MPRSATLPALAILALLSACGSSPEFAYVGANPGAPEGEYIKDPHALGASGRDARNMQGVVTLSNRVDIPVQEFVQISSEAVLRAASSRVGYGDGLARGDYALLRSEEGFFDRAARGRLYDASAANWVDASAGRSLFAAGRGFEETNRRIARGGAGAISAQRGAAHSHIADGPVAYHMRDGVSVARGEDFVSTLRGRTGYEAATAQRIIGIHLWKYADRDLVSDRVEITYTIVYYNTNEHDTGPTEILEHVPYYTEYVHGSATLPKQGVAVQYQRRTDTRHTLRWKFPHGIKAGETNKMTYKVVVRLDERYAPRDGEEAEPGRQ